MGISPQHIHTHTNIKKDKWTWQLDITDLGQRAESLKIQQYLTNVVKTRI